MNMFPQRVKITFFKSKFHRTSVKRDLATIGKTATVKTPVRETTVETSSYVLVTL